MLYRCTRPGLRNEAKSSYKNTSAGGWDIAADNWNKSSAVAQGQEEAWGKGNASKSVEINNSSDWGKPKSFGGDGSSGLKGEETRDDQNSSWSRPGNFEGGHGFGRGRGRGRGRESGDFDGRNDQGSWKSSWGGDNAGRPPWRSNNQVDNEAGDSDGYRGRGRGRGQYGGRGRDNGWRNGDRSNSGFGRESDCGDEPEWGNRGSRSFCENQSSTWNSSAENKPSVGEHNDPWASKVTSTEGKEQQNDPWGSKTVSTACAEDNGGSWNSKAKDSSSNDGGDERQNDPWANNIGSNKGTSGINYTVHSATGADDNNDSWNTKAKDTRLDSGDKWGSAAPVSSGAEDKADAWASKGSNDNSKKSDGWGAGSFGASWDKPSFSLGDQEPAWGKPRFSDDNNGNSRGGFGSGNRGRGRGQSFGDTGSSWNGGNNSNESGGGRSDDQWNRRDFDGSRGRGRGCFGRGGRNQGNNFGSGDGSSWSSGRGNSGRGGYRNWNDNERRPPGQGGGWSQSSGWNSNRGTSEGDQGFSKSKLRWGSDNNDSWGVPKSSDGDDQARKGDGNNTWRQNSSSSSILGQPSGGGNVSWEKSNEDSWNSSRGTGSTEKSSWGGSEVAPKKDGLLEQDKGSGNQGVGGSSSWDKADDAWNSNKGSDSGSGGWLSKDCDWLLQNARYEPIRPAPLVHYAVLTRPLDADEFRRQGRLVVDFIAEYYDRIDDYPVRPAVSPGFLARQLPETAPSVTAGNTTPSPQLYATSATSSFPGLTHWQSPHHFAHFAATASNVGALGEALAAGLNINPFTWAASPAATELEVVVTDWLGKALHVPENLLFSGGGGGGTLLGTSCEAMLCTIVAARDRKLAEIGEERIGDLVVYCSDQTHFSFQKAARIAGIRKGNCRAVATSWETGFTLSPKALLAAVHADVAAGRVPLFLCATVGTTPTAAVDPVRELCAALSGAGHDDVWVHVDAAYAGAACVCPEFRNVIEGVEAADSFSTNPHKWLLANMDCCALWVTRPHALTEALGTDHDVILKDGAADGEAVVVDYKDWQVALSRRFRALKLWLVLRCHGVDGLRAPSQFALVCFRLRPPALLLRLREKKQRCHDDDAGRVINELNRKLLEAVNATGRAYMSCAVVGGVYVLRCAIGNSLTEERHVQEAWRVVQEQATVILAAARKRVDERTVVGNARCVEIDDEEVPAPFLVGKEVTIS
ncbi:hypothetical protein PR202_ga05595 [Eleusine coracana subsp. coracana]|uniref:Tyrosine decarboxylase n=1 Tax=Eleusine coracana subsp. coracana TaxID=191504 RepID=A0AAV5BSZ0_ELECO|nr:hypothetical protein PR202_ga05141 [Eleusine coracana subsp. coracana]GJM89403.1 hypothetical protein PR202_ga05595 [Eleusine coracana subsp. coracana]